MLRVGVGLATPTVPVHTALQVCVYVCAYVHVVGGWGGGGVGFSMLLGWVPFFADSMRYLLGVLYTSIYSLDDVTACIIPKPIKYGIKSFFADSMRYLLGVLYTSNYSLDDVTACIIPKPIKYGIRSSSQES